MVWEGTGSRDSNLCASHSFASRNHSSQELMTIAMGKPLITHILLEAEGKEGGYEGRQHGATVLLTISGFHHTHRHKIRTQ